MKFFRLLSLLFVLTSLAVVLYACKTTPTGDSGHVGTITSITPSVVFVNDTVIAHGTNFGGPGMAGMVRCVGMTSKLIYWNDSSVCFVAPDMAMTGTLEIQCSCGGTASAQFPITVKAR